MSPSVVVLDTTAFSGLLYAREPLFERFRGERRKNTEFLLCPVVWYETRRGLQKIGAVRKLQRLNQIAPFFRWQNLDRADWLLAADTWAALAMQGRTPGDADLLIAVFAGRRNARLVTSNSRHFDVLASALAITVEDWLVDQG